MASTHIMTTQAECTQKMGANVSAGWTEAMTTAAGLQAESTVNSMCRYNFSDNYAALNADVKYLISDIVSSLVAIQAISYDMSGYNSRTEAEDMINVLRDGVLRGLSILRDKKTQDFINGA